MALHITNQTDLMVFWRNDGFRMTNMFSDQLFINLNSMHPTQWIKHNWICIDEKCNMLDSFSCKYGQYNNNSITEAH